MWGESQVVAKQLAPEWNEQFTFDLADGDGRYLQIFVWDKDRPWNHFLGGVSLSLEEINAAAAAAETSRLLNLLDRSVATEPAAAEQTPDRSIDATIDQLDVWQNNLAGHAKGEQAAAERLRLVESVKKGVRLLSLLSYIPGAGNLLKSIGDVAKTGTKIASEHYSCKVAFFRFVQDIAGFNEPLQSWKEQGMAGNDSFTVLQDAVDFADKYMCSTTLLDNAVKVKGAAGLKSTLGELRVRLNTQILLVVMSHMSGPEKTQVTLHNLLTQQYFSVDNATVEMPSFKAGGGKPVHLDAVFTEMYKVDHAELLTAGHSEYEDLLARKKTRVATGASIGIADNFARVLLEGKPGSGKTTLAKKLALDWARGYVEAFDLVFVLTLRSAQHIESCKRLGRGELDVLLHTTCLNGKHTTSPADVRDATSANCGRVLIVLDGLDEYQETLPPVNALLGIGVEAGDQHEWYAGCKVLVTSRPTSARTSDVRKWSDANYELMGFDPAQMETFVTRALEANPSEDKKVTPARRCCP